MLSQATELTVSASGSAHANQQHEADALDTGGTPDTLDDPRDTGEPARSLAPGVESVRGVVIDLRQQAVAVEAEIRGGLTAAESAGRLVAVASNAAARAVRNERVDAAKAADRISGCVVELESVIDRLQQDVLSGSAEGLSHALPETPSAGGDDDESLL